MQSIFDGPGNVISEDYFFIMELSDKFKGEFDRRAKLADVAVNLPDQGYAWSLAVIHLSYVSDYSGFVGLLQEHVGLWQKHGKKYGEGSPSDVIVEGNKTDELYVLMNGPKVDAVPAFEGFFNSLERLHSKDWVVGARVGILEYGAKSTVGSMIDLARKRQVRYSVGKPPGAPKPGLKGGLERVV